MLASFGPPADVCPTPAGAVGGAQLLHRHLRQRTPEEYGLAASPDGHTTGCGDSMNPRWARTDILNFPIGSCKQGLVKFKQGFQL